MTWLLRAGKAARSIEAMARSGAKVPALEERKSIAGLTWLLEAFLSLHTTRAVAFGGPLPIPWTAVQQYGEAHQMNEDEAHVLDQVISDLDAIWLAWARRKK